MFCIYNLSSISYMAGLKTKSENGRPTPDPMVVGIGASAGGLEALQEFFRNMPVNSGMAFVVIQHLSPDYKSLMDELLARYTSMPISIITDGVVIVPDHIYLIPPRRNVVIYQGKLLLEDQSLRKGLNLPVDIFFRSLALERGKNAIGVILSGTGSDGTLGTRAIKENGGMIMVQDEESAKFDGMPRSSIATGLVDYILPPDKMPEALDNYVKHPFVKKGKTLESVLSKNLDTLSKILFVLKEFSGIDFSYYKENTIIRRLERRVSINLFTNPEDYLAFLLESDKEKDILYRELLIGVTRFFRDAEAFESITKNVLPNLHWNKAMRIWSTGCSTGEEVYSIAILVNEYMEKHHPDCDVKIFASDIDRRSIDLASQGYYPDSIMADVEPVYLTKYFTRKENGYQVNEMIRKKIVFATHNLLKDPPFSKIDLLICRNLFIYLKPEIQSRLLNMFFHSVNPRGFLFLGSSETIGEYSDAFETIDTKWKIYKPLEGYIPPMMKDVQLQKKLMVDPETILFSKNRQLEGVKFEKLLDQIMSALLPPSILIDGQDNIIHLMNDTSRFLKLPPGKFSQNLMHNLTPDLSLLISAHLRKLRKHEKEVVVDHLYDIKGFEDQNLLLEGRVIETNRTTYYLLSFRTEDQDISRPKSKRKAGAKDDHFRDKMLDLEKELQYTKESLQATVEELETSNEELQSSNEELIASNEELQSTNEELQSVNEELYTVNSEYQNKIEELTRLNGDMNNLLKNTDVGALYLDQKLCIRRVTPLVSKITNILPSDLGRPISHISVMAGYKNLIEDVDQVMQNLKPIDREISLSDGAVYYTRIRPYRTENNAVDGILLTFVDISSLKEIEYQRNILNERLTEVLKGGNLAWWEWNLETGVVSFDEHKATMLGYTVKEFPTDVMEICNLIHPDDYELTMQIMRDHLEGRAPMWDATYRIKRKDGTYAWYYDRGHISKRDKNGKPLKLLGTVIEISKIKNLEEELRQRKSFLDQLLDESPMAKLIVNANGRIIYANQSAGKLFGLSPDKIMKLDYNSPEWKISNPEGKPLKDQDLPFSVVKKTGQPVYNHLLCVHNQKGESVKLTITGAPLFNHDNEFEGCLFNIGLVNNG